MFRHILERICHFNADVSVTNWDLKNMTMCFVHMVVAKRRGVGEGGGCSSAKHAVSCGFGSSSGIQSCRLIIILYVQWIHSEKKYDLYCLMFSFENFFTLLDTPPLPVKDCEFRLRPLLDNNISLFQYYYRRSMLELKTN